MAVLLGPDGQPINKQSLVREESAPDIRGVRTVLPTHTMVGIDPQKLAAIMRAADEGDFGAYLEMAERLEEKDAHYLSVIGTRKRAVSRMEITVDAASDDPVDVENQKLVQEWLERDTLQEELFDILDAVGKGFSICEMIWDTSASQWDIKELKWRDPRWYEMDRHDGQTPLLRGMGGMPQPLTPYKYIYHQHKSKSGLPIRSGVARACAWMFLFKNFSVKDWMVFMEAYGQPIRIGKYGPGATAEDRAVLLRAVASIGSDAAAIIPDSMQIEFVESQGKTASVDLYDRAARFFDEQMSKAVLGQTTTTDALPGGGLAGNEAHNEVRGDIADSDASQLSTTLNRQVVVPLVTLNRGVQKKYPRIRIGNAEKVDADKVSLVADRMARAGARISKSKIVEKLGLPAAEDDDDVLTPLPAATPGFASARRMNTTLAAAAPRADAIDRLAEEQSGDWEEILTPFMDVVEEALNGSSNFEEFSNKLLAVAGKADLGPAAERIGRATFAARLAGNLGQKVK